MLSTVRDLKTSGTEANGRPFASLLLVKKLTSKTASNGNPFYSVDLGDRTGSFGCTIFSDSPAFDIIKTGGANVSPLEIDAVIRECPGVKLSQTVGVPDHLLGEMVVGCIVAHTGASLDEASIKGFAKEKLASYKVPRRVLFFAEDELKTTGSAKIKTDELRKLAAERLAAEG